MLYFSKRYIWVVAVLCLTGLVLSLPSFIPSATRQALEGWGLQLRRIYLGLDLQGGSSLLLKADSDLVVGEQLDTMVDQVRTLLRGAELGYTELKAAESAVQFQLLKAEHREQAVAVLEEFLNQGLTFGMVPDYQVTTSGDSLVSLRLTPAAKDVRADRSIQQAIEIIRRRIDESGVSEPSIARQGKDRILVQLPGVDDPDRIKRLLGKTAKMTFRLLHPESDSYLGGAVPAGAVLLDAQVERPGFPQQYLVRRRVDVDGSHLIDAQVGSDPYTGEWVVNFTFDAVGARRFARVTENNVNRAFAIVLDNQVVSAPVINEPIPGGRGQISGGFTAQEASDLAVLLRAGALPVPLTIIEERTVGPDLGADAIQAGVYACLVGFVLVIGYMLLTYGVFGIIASLALMANLILVAGLLSVLQATLTLPGIAGLLLTLGMAVDANILINERIREEIRRLHSPYQAVESGFRRAFATIVDSNLTTLIAMILLYSFGSGPVRGFAVTISCGILTSMFSAMVLARLMIVSWLRNRLRRSKDKDIDQIVLAGHQLADLIIPVIRAVDRLRGR